MKRFFLLSIFVFVILFLDRQTIHFSLEKETSHLILIMMKMDFFQRAIITLILLQIIL